MQAVYNLQFAGDPQPMVDLALGVVSRGYNAVKVFITPPTEALNSIAAYRAAENRMAALRNALGDDIDIMVDCHGRHSPATPSSSAACWRPTARTSS